MPNRELHCLKQDLWSTSFSKMKNEKIFRLEPAIVRISISPKYLYLYLALKVLTKQDLWSTSFSKMRIYPRF